MGNFKGGFFDAMLLGSSQFVLLSQALFNILFLQLFYLYLLPLSGALSVWSILRQKNMHPLVFLMPFYALVPVSHQTFLYNSYVIGLALCVFLWVATGFWRVCAVIFVGAFIAVPVFQLPQKTTEYISYGFPVYTELVPFPHPRARLRVPKKDAEFYGPILRHLEDNTTPKKTFLKVGETAASSMVEINFLAQRRAPMRFFNIVYETQTPKTRKQFQNHLRQAPPSAILASPEPRFRFFGTLSQNYQTIGHYEDSLREHTYELWLCVADCGSVFE